jgi:hypothetical protein
LGVAGQPTVCLLNEFEPFAFEVRLTEVQQLW